MRFCMGWRERVSGREGGEVLGWEWGDFFIIYGRLGYGNGL